MSLVLWMSKHPADQTDAESTRRSAAAFIFTEVPTVVYKVCVDIKDTEER